MTFPYVAFPACYGRLPLSRGRVSGVCMEHPISSNNVRCTHFLPLMRRTAYIPVSLLLALVILPTTPPNAPYSQVAAAA